MLNELNNFVYENHYGKRFDSLANGIYLNHSDILDYSWNYDVINNRISRFYRDITSKTLPLVVIGKTADEAIAAKNNLLEIAETDIQALQAGKIYVGDYYLNGYITASKKSKYLYNKRYGNLNLAFTSTNPAWHKDKVYTFAKSGDTATAGAYGVDYPYDYTFDYAAAVSGQQIIADGIGNSKFKLKIYGVASNPAISIGGHVYCVNGDIGQGETLLIDSVAKTITLTKATGAKENWFDKRSRESYIFEPIPAGSHGVIYDNSFGFDLTVIEERSEPKWT